MGLRTVLYNLLLFAFLILGLPWIVYQFLFVGKRRRGFAQRMGRAPEPDGPVIWCHAVSVGEVLAIEPMLSLLQEDERTAGRIVLSTVTPTGQETAKRECGFVQRIFFFPLDLPFAVSRALDKVRPEIFVTAETEIWPNFFSACSRRDVPVVLVNGRISDTSFPRYLKFRWFFRPFLRGVSLFLMQSEEDARRVLELGARPETVAVTGNTKYDRVPQPVPLPEEVTRWASSGFLFVAGSTHEGEEEAILEAVRSLKGRRIRTAIVPRHPERFDTVASLLDRKRVSWERFSGTGDGGTPDADFLLVDAMGVLDGFYALADAAFVGGSLVPVGGHNLLEPAMHGVPVLTGPHLHNFREIAQTLVDSGGCRVVDDQTALGLELENLLSDGVYREKMGKQARIGSESTKGASRRNLDAILAILLPGTQSADPGEYPLREGPSERVSK
ncbi:MAG: 3-deoxy-D-manno-octulosonic acid transferase [bacterium]|nr:3-deoxy-D-manno-octulosonic acid transferase [bacterium]